MKLIKSHLWVMLASIVALGSALRSNAEGSFHLSASDGSGSTSFNAIGHWTNDVNGSAPTVGPMAGTNYGTAGNQLRTPTGSQNYTFGGDSLTINPGGTLALKNGTGFIITINNLTNSGVIGDADAANAIATLAGNMVVVGTASMNTDSTPPSDLRHLTNATTMSGTGALTNYSGGTVVYTGANTAFTGQVNVGPYTYASTYGTTLQVSSQANLGGNPAVFNPAQLLLDNGILQPLASFSLNNANSGVTLYTGGGTFNCGSGITLTIANPVAGPGQFTETGAGTVILGGANTYSGPTAVNGGTLLVNGSTGANTVTVAAGASLGGSGTIGGATTIQSGATLKAGSSSTIGTLTVASTLTLNSVSTNFMRISVTGGTPTNDVIATTGLLTLGGTLVVSNATSDSTPLSNGQTFTLFNAAGGFSGAFASLVLPSLPAGWVWNSSSLYTSGQITASNASVTLTPGFSLASGGYIGAQTVTISCLTPNATIYYTTNGVTPTLGSPSGSSPVNVMVPVNSTMTIQAFAQAPGYSASGVASATYLTESEAVWTNVVSPGSWSVAANWTNGIIPNGGGFTADFSQLTLQGNVDVTLDGSWTVGNLIFGDQANSSSWEIDSGSGGPLTLAVASGSPTITVSNQTAAITAVLAGTNGLTTAGAGTLTLSGLNTYTGNTIVNGAMLVYQNTMGNNATTYSGAGTVQLGSGVTALNLNATFGSLFTGLLDLETSGTVNAVNNTCFSNNLGSLNVGPGNFEINNSTEQFASLTGSGTIENTAESTHAPATLTIGANNASGTFSGEINTVNAGVGNGTVNGAISLIKIGTGTLTLAGANNTYTGNTIVSNGVLVLASGSQIPNSAVTVSGGLLQVNGMTGSGGVTVNQNAIVDGTGAIGGPVTIESGGTLAVGTEVDPTALVGTLTLSSTLALDSGCTNFLRITKTGGAPASDLISGATLDYNGTLTVTNITSDGTPLANGDTFTIFSASSGYGGSFSQLILPALASGLSWNVSQLTVNGSISVVNSAATPIFNPPAGSYIGALSVAISSLTPGATIYYTTNGTTPTTSSPVYSAAIAVPVNTTMTIQAFVQAPGFGNSAVASATYETEAGPAVWTDVNGGSWSQAGNWTNNIIPNQTGVTADFSELTLQGNVDVTLDGSWTVGNLIFGDQGNSSSWEIDSGSGGPLTLAVASGSPTITVNNQTATITAALAGNSGLATAGAGTLTLSGQNIYTGNTVVNGAMLVYQDTMGNNATTYSGAGTVQLGSGLTTLNGNAAFGSSFTGLIDLEPGGVLSGIGNTSFANNLGGLNVGAATIFEVNGTTMQFDALTGSGIIENTAEATHAPAILTIGANNGSGTFSGQISTVNAGVGSGTVNGAITVVKNGAGSQALSGENTYTGPTMVNDGTLEVDGSLSSNSAVTVTNAVLDGMGEIGGPTTIENGGTLEAGTNSVAGIGILTIASTLTLNPGSTTRLRLDEAAATNDSLAGISTLTYGGTLSVTNLAGTLEAGDAFQLFAATNYVGGFDATNLPSPGAGLAWNWSPTNGTLAVVVAPPSPPVIQSAGSLSHGTFTLTFSGSNGQSFTVLMSTNVALPRAMWLPLTNGAFGATAVTFTDTGATNAERFYLIESP